MPDQLFSLTIGELDALHAHHLRERAWVREQAAYSGWCAAKGVASWFNDGLPSFNEFYGIPDEAPLPKQYTSEEYVDRYNSWK